MADEVDLWNLEEEQDAPQIKLTDETPPTGPPPSDSPDPEAVFRIEPADAHHRARKKAKALQTPEPGEPAVAAMKPEMIPRSAIRKSISSGVGMTEDEVWNDFISDESNTSATPKTEPTPTPQPTPLSEQKPLPVVSPSSDVITTPAVSEPAIAEAEEVREMKSEIPAVTEPATAQPAPQEKKEEEAEKESFAPPAPRTHAATWQISRFSRTETILSLAFLMLLIGGGFWGMQLFQQNVQTESDPYAEPKLPAAGRLATIQSAETYWRVPITDGPDADTTQREVILIPVIDLTLGSGTSPQGVIRVMFYNERGEIVGDTITRPYRDNRFTRNDSSTASFASTTGFTTFGEQEAYRAYLGKPWSIRVYEGPDETAPSSAFQLLFSTPISTRRK